MFQTAFQANAFQVNAFQIFVPAPSGQTGGDGFTLEEWRRAQKLGKKIAERQRKLEKALKDDKDLRKQGIRDLIDPVAKVKQAKVQSKQIADIPSVDIKELERSISYLERQRNNILAAVAYRQKYALLEAELQMMEAKRLEELDDEETLLYLL